jgi:hypothetical protein
LNIQAELHCQLLEILQEEIYRFNFTGDKQYIEPVDAIAMMSIPMLKRLI